MPLWAHEGVNNEEGSCKRNDEETNETSAKGQKVVQSGGLREKEPVVRWSIFSARSRWAKSEVTVPWEGGLRELEPANFPERC